MLWYGCPPNVNSAQYKSTSCLVVGSTSLNGRSPPCATSSALVNGSSTMVGGFDVYWAHRCVPPSTPCWNALTRSKPDPCEPLFVGSPPGGSLNSSMPARPLSRSPGSSLSSLLSPLSTCSTHAPAKQSACCSARTVAGNSVPVWVWIT